MQSKLQENEIFTGLAISSGKIVAEVCVFSAKRHQEIAAKKLNSDDEVANALQRFDEAVRVVSSDLDAISEKVKVYVGKAESEIFITQMHILNDQMIIDEIKNRVTELRQNIEFCVSDVFLRYEQQFSNFDDKYLAERSSDIGDVRRRVLDVLMNTTPGFNCESQGNCAKGKDRIIAAETLTAQMMTHMNLKHVLGLVTEHGGVSSHAAIIARSLGIPAVSGLKNIYTNVHCGMKMLVDGDNGIAIINPTQEKIEEIIPVEPVIGDALCFLSSPHGIEVLANASLIEDIEHARMVRADGIGLLRTEIQFIKEAKLLSVEEQYDFYSKVFTMLNGLPVTYRLLDIGGDKELPFLNIKKEENPFLGWRGARFLLGNHEILFTQLRALVQVSFLGKIKIMFPMIVDSKQTELLRDITMTIIEQEKGKKENIEIGVMFEVPSACIQAKAILHTVDFASIGSNDLIQYLFAVDRNNESVSQDYNPEHPVLWDVISNVSTIAQSLHKPLSICGEMAGREGIPTRLCNEGIYSISVSPRLIPRVRTELHALLDNTPL